MNNIVPITVTITTCNRLDLLKQTIDSFLLHNSYPIAEYLMTDDSDNTNIAKELELQYGNRFKIFHNSPKLGLSKSLDVLFGAASNEYIFHLEDDWLFDRSGFIEDSLSIMTHQLDVHQVWVRHRSDTPHKHNKDGTLSLWQNWNGYSWNPGLRRKSDYQKMFPDGLQVYGEEFDCMQHTKNFDYKVISLINTSCYHIGYNRHTENFIP